MSISYVKSIHIVDELETSNKQIFFIIIISDVISTDDVNVCASLNSFKHYLKFNLHSVLPKFHLIGIKKILVISFPCSSLLLKT